MKSKIAIRWLFESVGKFINDESGAELVEIVLVVGLIAVICLVAMNAFGPKVQLQWNTVADSQ